jgi:hypothetical protein
MGKKAKKRLAKRMAKIEPQVSVKAQKLTEFDLQEALSRALFFAEVFDGYMLDHPVVAQKAKLKLRAEKISTEMHDLYQAVGKVELKKAKP